MSSEITLNPVGSVEVENGRFSIVLKQRYRKALNELEGFSHITILWWGNQTASPENRDVLVAKKPYRNGPNIVGIFATRSEARPNPVLITTAAVIHIERDEGVIELSWIDAENGSPVLDIKPYQPCSDRVKHVQSPDWCAEWPQWYEDSASFDWNSVFNF